MAVRRPIAVTCGYYNAPRASIVQERTVREHVAAERVTLRRGCRVTCPLCVSSKTHTASTSLSIDPETGCFYCYRCRLWGHLVDATDYQPVRMEHIPYTPTLPSEFIPLSLDNPHAGWLRITHDARMYLHNRRITKAMIKQWNVGCCLRGFYAGRIVVPITGVDGRLKGFVARDFTGAAKVKYLYPGGFERDGVYCEGFKRGDCLFNERAVEESTTVPLLVVEGVFDTFPFGTRACAIMGKITATQIDILARATRPIAIVLDGDAWRDGEAIARVLKLRGKRCTSIRLAPGYDPDEVPPHEIDTLISQQLHYI